MTKSYLHQGQQEILRFLKNTETTRRYLKGKCNLQRLCVKYLNCKRKKCVVGIERFIRKRHLDEH